MTTNIASLNMPSWSEAPEWACYLALDPDGTWYWFRKYPQLEEGYWEDCEKHERAGKTSRRLIPDFRDHVYSHPNMNDLPSTPEEAQLIECYNTLKFGYDDRPEFSSQEDEPSSTRLDAINIQYRSKSTSINGILEEVANKVDERGQERDEENGERSIPAANKAWWQIYGNRIIERGYPLDSELWAFMLILKLVRNTRDDMLDAVAYMALSLESFDKEDNE